MSEADPNKMFNVLTKEQKHIILVWLHSNWLTDKGEKTIREIYDRGIYNQGHEKKLLIKLREEWIDMYKRARNK